jgi:hypothetical protein
MSDVDWGSEGKELPKPKKRVPLWVWICGGGCLLAVIVAVSIAIFAASKFSHMMNQDEQWAKLAKVLPFDEKPQGARIVGTGEFAGMAPGIEDMWQIQSLDMKYQANIMRFSAATAAEQRKNLATGELGSDAQQRIGPFGLFELQHGSVDVQGRELPWVRCQTFEKTADESADTEEKESGEKPGIAEAMKMAFKQRIMMVDITPEGAPGALVLQYIELGKGGPVETSDVVEFLTPFQIGPKHEVK